MKEGPERDERFMTLLETALERPLSDREAFLQHACAGDEALYQELLDSVAWEERMGDFLLDPLIPCLDWEPPFKPGELISGRFRIVREIDEGVSTKGLTRSWNNGAR